MNCAQHHFNFCLGNLHQFPVSNNQFLRQDSDHDAIWRPQSDREDLIGHRLDIRWTYTKHHHKHHAPNRRLATIAHIFGIIKNDDIVYAIKLLVIFSPAYLFCTNHYEKPTTPIQIPLLDFHGFNDPPLRWGDNSQTSQLHCQSHAHPLPLARNQLIAHDYFSHINVLKSAR